MFAMNDRVYNTVYGNGSVTSITDTQITIKYDNANPQLDISLISGKRVMKEYTHEEAYKRLILITPLAYKGGKINGQEI